MSKKVIFNGNLGNSFARKRRRMPGTNKKFTPEIKAWDCMNPANTTIGTADQFEIHEIGNLASFPEALPQDYHYSWTPLRIQFPTVGANPYNRIGERFLFKYLKIKGYVQVMRRCANPINWRLCLIRWDNAQNAGFNRATYNSMFKMLPSVPAGYTIEDWAQWGFKAFYNKIKNPDMASRFKRKVIASGHVPSCYNEIINDGHLTPSGQQPGLLQYESTTNSETTGEIAALMPIDITVTVNDNVDTSINYYLLLETDIVYGITPNSYNPGSNSGDKRAITVLTDQFTIKFFTKGYFEDY